MRWKTIAAVIATRGAVDQVLDFALPLAARNEAHLIGIHAEALPIVYASEVGFPDASLIHATSEANRRRSEEIGAIFSARAAEAGVSSEWRLVESFAGDSPAGALAAARAADLIVAAQPDPDGEAASSAGLDALLFDAGRPLLVTPAAGPATTTFRRVLVAWNGSREAARATFDALPLIVEAASTEILIIDPHETSDGGSEPDGADVAAALSRHGAEVFVVRETARGRSVEDSLRTRVSEAGIDLLVLGAYSHSWLRQVLFGGVTRSLMQSIPVATFLSR